MLNMRTYARNHWRSWKILPLLVFTGSLILTACQPLSANAGPATVPTLAPPPLLPSETPEPLPTPQASVSPTLTTTSTATATATATATLGANGPVGQTGNWTLIFDDN